MMKIRILAGLWLLTAAVACGTTGIKSKMRSLDDAITDYHVSLRWSMLDKIEAYHQGRNGERKPLDRSSLNRVRITGYTIIDRNANPEATEAVVKGEVDFYTTDSGTLRKHAFTENWWYSEAAKRWFISSDYLTIK